MARGGLSPRVRGNLRGETLYWTGLGSIPACAGEPVMRPSSPSSSEVYPRVCGGTAAGLSHRSRSSGLSPRVRGNLVGGEVGLQGIRSIPACAGEPGALTSPVEESPVYPRVCGGTSQDLYERIMETGLSPRVRGNPLLHVDADAQLGSIPACAGEPIHATTISRATKVYPRVCGGTP